jgi:SpoVK/Ycf46/Vps4 family AAA+-type ATPase
MNKFNTIGLIKALSRGEKEDSKKWFEISIADEKSETTKMELKEIYSKYMTPSQKEMTFLPESIKRFFCDYPAREIENIFIDKKIKEAVEFLIKSFENTELFRKKGIGVPNKIIMEGPPGNGKTSLASAIAGKLNMPLFSVNTPAVINSYLGKTSVNINLIMNQIPHPSVIFWDEFDTLASSRKDEGGGAQRELNNIVNSILLGMDRLSSDNVMIVASNRGDMLDKAILRRFFLKLWIGPPQNKETAFQFIQWWQSHTQNPIYDTNNFPFPASYSILENWCVRRVQSQILGMEIPDTEWIGKEKDIR